MASVVIDNSDLLYNYGLKAQNAKSLSLNFAAPASATQPLLLLGPTLLASAAAAGSYIGCNKTGTADFIAFQASGTDVFVVEDDGTIVSTAGATYTTLTASGLITGSATGVNAFALTGAPINTATLSLARIGVAIASGDTTASGGTYLAIGLPNTGAGSVADAIVVQKNGVDTFVVEDDGRIVGAVGMVLAGAVSGITTLAGTGAISGFTSLAITAGISGVTTLAGSGAISGFTSLALSAGISGVTTLAGTGAVSGFTSGSFSTTMSATNGYSSAVLTATTPTGTDTNHTQVAITAQQIIDMYTTPVALVAAPGAGKSIIVKRAVFRIIRTSTQFTGGGVVVFQYAATANGAGLLSVDSTIAAAVVTGTAGTVVSMRNGAIISDSASTVTDAVGLFLSNQTGVFAAGTGTATCDIWYAVV